MWDCSYKIHYECTLFAFHCTVVLTKKLTKTSDCPVVFIRDSVIMMLSDVCAQSISKSNEKKNLDENIWILCVDIVHLSYVTKTVLFLSMKNILYSKRKKNKAKICLIITEQTIKHS